MLGRTERTEQGATFPMLPTIATGLTLLSCVILLAAALVCRGRRLRGRSVRSAEPSGTFYVWALGIALAGFALLAVSIHT
jgi:hypothetical protein